MVGHIIQNYWFTWFPGALVATTILIGLAWKGLRVLFKVEQALPTLYQIHAEFSPNGGGSMKDRVEALHSNQEDLTQRFRDHVKDDSRNFNKIDAALERIEDKL